MAQSYIFGEGTGTTYEQLKRRREMADLLMARGGSRTPRNVGEGLNSFGSSIAGALMARNADKKLGKGREQASSAFGDIMGSMLGGMPMGDAINTPQQQYAQDRVSQSHDAAGIRSGLVERGLPEHVADAFIMNFKDESNLNPGINEQNPVVEGSRGGFGLAQWTGPRRKALEAFAAQKGTPVSDADTQMDFLMYELQGPEAGAFKDIMGAGNTGEAAAAIVNKFLRPAEEHRSAREARYLGASPQRSSVMQQHDAALGGALAGGQPVRQPASQQGGVDPRLIKLMDNPYLTEGQRSVAGALLNKQLKSLQPPSRREQLELQKLEQEVNKQPDRKIIKAGDGYNYYQDTGERVLPDVNIPAPPPKTQKMLLEDGSEAAVQWNPKTATWDPINAPSGGRGAAPRDKLTESQSKLTLFQSMQDETQPALLDLEKQWNPANIADAAARATPIAGNFFQSPEGQIYNAAATQWAEGALRIATGAAATPEEMERTKRAYFAQPGDIPMTVAYKAQMRESYARAIRRSLGERNVEGGLPSPSEFRKQFEDVNGTPEETPEDAPRATDTGKFGKMDADALGAVDIDSLTDEEQDQMLMRIEELENSMKRGRL